MVSNPNRDLPKHTGLTCSQEKKCNGFAVFMILDVADVLRYNLSPGALDLLMQMLQHDRHARPTIKEALKHKFNNDGYDLEKA